MREVLKTIILHIHSLGCFFHIHVIALIFPTSSMTLVFGLVGLLDRNHFFSSVLENVKQIEKKC